MKASIRSTIQATAIMIGMAVSGMKVVRQSVYACACFAVNLLLAANIPSATENAIAKPTNGSRNGWSE